MISIDCFNFDCQVIDCFNFDCQVIDCFNFDVQVIDKKFVRSIYVLTRNVWQEIFHNEPATLSDEVYLISSFSYAQEFPIIAI